jgi:hypothetical protein
MRKTERFAFKLTPEDKQALCLLADAEGEQLAVILRRLIREAFYKLEKSTPQPILKSHTFHNPTVD